MSDFYSDLDDFFKGAYEYYYQRGYGNILTKILLENISFFFVINFAFINCVVIDWFGIIKACSGVKNCELSMEYIHFPTYDTISQNKTLFIFYFICIVYCLKNLIDSYNFLSKMKKMREFYHTKLNLRKKDIENLTWSEIMSKIIVLHHSSPLSRRIQNMDQFDIVARILRKENYITALVSNNILRFSIYLPFIGEKCFYSNFISQSLHSCLMDYAFVKDKVEIDEKFKSPKRLRLRLFYYMIIELIFILPIFALKLLLWVFSNADNIKSNRNITQKIWSPYIKTVFVNYNELKHNFDNRIVQSYYCIEKFQHCFQERFISILAKFLSLIGGSFFIVICIVTALDDSLLLEMKVFGKNLVWYTIVLGAVLSIRQSINSGDDSDILRDNIDYTELTELKEDLYKSLINKLINIPESWRIKQNFSSKIKEMSSHYLFSVSLLIDELISILLFPYFWLKLMFQTRDIIAFMKNYTFNSERLGDICSLSLLDYKNFSALKEKRMGIDEKFNERKFINSFYYFEKFYGVNLEDDNIYNEYVSNKYDPQESQRLLSKSRTIKDIVVEADSLNIFSLKFEKKMFSFYQNDRGKFHYFDRSNYKLFWKIEFEDFRKLIHYYLNETNQTLFQLDSFNLLFPQNSEPNASLSMSLNSSASIELSTDKHKHEDQMTEFSRLKDNEDPTYISIKSQNESLKSFKI